MAKKTTTKKAAKKPAARKPAAKKAARKTTAKAAAAAPKAVKITGASKVRTKGEIFNTLADFSGATRKQVSAVFDGMSQMIAADLKKGAAGQFKVPGMLKVTVQRKPATKARKGINPFTKEEVVFKAKPARNVIKVRPLKSLKDMVG
jgi:nucleoid DNA-binding protein